MRLSKEARFCFEVLPALSVYPPPTNPNPPAVVPPAQAPINRQARQRGSVYAWRIIGGFDNHSHTPKTNAITKLIVFKVEAGSGRRSQQS